MNTSTVMATSYLALLVGLVGLLATAITAYAKAPRRSTSIKSSTNTAEYWATTTEMELAIAEFFVVKYCTQAMVSGYYQTAKNLRKQGVPLEVARMIGSTD